MNSTTTIHLAQRLITIETDALVTLQNYLDALKKYFGTQESGDEIYADIENRVSEIMSKKLKTGAVCITNADIASIKSTVGSLQELGIEEPLFENNFAQTATNNAQQSGTENIGNANSNGTNNTNNNNNANYASNNGKRKLYRNANDKILSGLCSGVGSYLNVDPVWVRVVFVLCGFFGGIGIIAYIIGSIIIPTSTDAVFANKRLMRSYDDKALAGVCSGLAKYFGTTALNMRLLFLAPLILSICFGITNSSSGEFIAPLNGPFFLIYILLWLIVPFAQTASEKLQMSGVPVNVNNIRNKIYGTSNNNIPSTTKNSGCLGTIAKALAFCFFGFIAFAMVMSFTTIFFGGIAAQPYTEYLFRPGNQQFLAQASWILVFGLPLILIVVLIGRALVGIKGWPTYLVRTFLLAFAIGIFCLIVLGADMKNDFKYQSTLPSTQQHSINADSIAVDLQTLNINNTIKNLKLNGLKEYNDSLFLNNVDIKINPSTDNSYHILITPKASGNNITEANKNANLLNYVTSLNGTTVSIPSNFKILRNNLWRNQEILVDIQVPEGKNIKFTNRLYDNPFTKIRFDFISIESETNNSLEDYESEVLYTMLNGKLQKTYAQTNNNKAKISFNNGKDSIEVKLKDSTTLLDSLGTSKEEIINKTQDAIDKLQDKLDEISDELEEEK